MEGRGSEEKMYVASRFSRTYNSRAVPINTTTVTVYFVRSTLEYSNLNPYLRDLSPKVGAPKYLTAVLSKTIILSNAHQYNLLIPTSANKLIMRR